MVAKNFPVSCRRVRRRPGHAQQHPDGTFLIEFFGNAACDASGNGEGATFLGAHVGHDQRTGNATIPLFLVSTLQFVTATATDAANNTSEFSTCVQSGAPAPTLHCQE